MRDVLAKPFTKDGMIGKLRRHLASFLRNPPQDSMIDPMYPNGSATQPPTPGPYSNQNMGQLAGGASAGVGKFETTPIQSPATSTSWNSPSQLPQPSPTITHEQGGYLAAGSGTPMGLTPGGSQKPPTQFHNAAMTHMAGPPQARMSDAMARGDGPPEKRQRLYGPSGGFQ